MTVEKIARGTRKAAAPSNCRPSVSENMVLFQYTKAVDLIGQVNRLGENRPVESHLSASFRTWWSTTHTANPRKYCVFLRKTLPRRHLYREELAEGEIPGTNGLCRPIFHLSHYINWVQFLTRRAAVPGGVGACQPHLQPSSKHEVAPAQRMRPVQPHREVRPKVRVDVA